MAGERHQAQMVYEENLMEELLLKQNFKQLILRVQIPETILEAVIVITKSGKDPEVL